jgi:thiol-disulfide isomerase/thioredoxin
MKHSLRAVTVLLICCAGVVAQAKRAPNIELKDLKGSTQKLSSLRGSIVVLNFWATWCGPCKEELPLLSKLTQQYAGKNIRFVAASINAPKERAKVDEFLGRNPVAMDVWVGADLDMLDSAGLGNILPGTLILDDQGEIVARIQGEARETDVTGPIEWLLNGRTGPAPQAVTKRY